MKIKISVHGVHESDNAIYELLYELWDIIITIIYILNN